MDNREILIGIHGRAGAGKDAAARHIAEKFHILQVAFADPIKRALVNLFGPTYGLTLDYFEGEKKEQVIKGLGKSPRQLMQSFGTEWGRDRVNTQVWIGIAQATIKARRNVMHAAGFEFPGTVISDIRFDNEAQWIRDRGGIVIRLHSKRSKPVNPHNSESGICVNLIDAAISNNGTLEELHKKLDDIVLDLMVSLEKGVNFAT